ncbi:CYTH domain-containing protein [Ornithinibacillus xuwenensis]|uniref:CYTH domain-containing protein n=1 Tax=Ornithinibacillus xuwenensis TaxID=3144668 RepID=A0ABU9XJG8_9BACI
MAQEIEIEFKNLLTKAEYVLLLDRLPFPKEGQNQTNYYFETTDNKLQIKNSALRIREKNEAFKLTLKEPHPEGLLETHDSLTKREAMEWMNGNPIPKEATTKQLNQLGVCVADLIYKGKLMTSRHEYDQDGLIYVLDHSIYLDHEDYELEIEATNRQAGLQALDTVLNDWGIERKETPNKIARFFSRIK